MSLKSFLAFLIIIPLLLNAGALATRTVISETRAVADSSAPHNAWAALSSTTGHYLNYTADGKQILLVNTTAASTHGLNVTVEKGSFWRSSLGNATFTLAVNKTYVLGPFESSRFKQSNGQLYVDINATRGRIIAIRLP